LLDDFDAPEPDALPEPVPEPEVIPPTHPEEELRLARAQAFDEGFQKGVLDAGSARAAETAATLLAIAGKLDDASDQATRVVEASARAMMKLLVEIVVAGYPTLRARYGAQEIGRLTRALLPALVREPKVVVQVNPALADAVAAELADQPRLTVIATPSMPPGDTRIAWKDGFAVRDTAVTWAAVTEVLGPLGLLPETAPAALAANT
jgi:flagellar biosynthesis/type III secretory pathway protein FliH